MLIDVMRKRQRRERMPRGSREQRAARAASPTRAHPAAPEQAASDTRIDAPRVAHTPVLTSELVQVLHPRAGQTAVDCTFGGGGHARAVARRLGAQGTLVAIDRDPAAERCFAGLAQEVSCSLRFIRGEYREALTSLAAEGLDADLVYFDLGMSSMQLDHGERGFSYSYDAPLDMRMDPDQELSAWEIVNRFDQRRLRAIMWELGEERHAGAIARAIVQRRSTRPLQTTLELVETINSAIPAPARFAAGHPAKRVFQAVRIAVNDELTQLEGGLPAAWQLLRPGGVLGAIAFHSLEDRRVKRFLAARARGCVCPPELPVCVCHRTPEAELRPRRAIVPSVVEVARNPRAASARLRAARKLDSEAAPLALAPRAAGASTRDLGERPKPVRPRGSRG
jgi:16S rRNA (cytosine1402-N4)-methyltransferase